MTSQAKCSFSIDHILHVAGGSTTQPTVNSAFEWINCTRYRPPRLQRAKKKEGVQKRNTGRNPRIPFSPGQVALLEHKFLETPYLSSHQVHQLAEELQLSDIRVKIWFQNRRARERREDKKHDDLHKIEEKSNMKVENNVKSENTTPCATVPVSTVNCSTDDALAVASYMSAAALFSADVNYSRNSSRPIFISTRISQLRHTSISS